MTLSVCQLPATSRFKASKGSARKPVKALVGNVSSAYDFGDILVDEWTMCTLSRYTGDNRKRIFVGTGNFAHGHHKDLRGVADTTRG